MIIVGKELLKAFAEKHTTSKNALKRWVQILELMDFNHHNDLKRIFPSADYVGNGRYVFNIKGNDFRLIAVITFIGGVAEIRFVGTHAEYDKIKNIENI